MWPASAMAPAPSPGTCNGMIYIAIAIAAHDTNDTTNSQTVIKLLRKSQAERCPDSFCTEARIGTSTWVN